MRWSLFFVCLLTVLFSVAFHEVLGYSNDHDSSSGKHRLAIERRSPVVSKTGKKPASQKSGHKSIKASAFKTSTYRKVAMNSGGDYDSKKNTVQKSKITQTQAKKKDAGMSLISARWTYSLTRR